MRSDFLSNGFKASEELLLLLEDAKKKLDYSIDKLPGIYFVFDEEGVIYRNNWEFLKCFENSEAINDKTKLFDLLAKGEKPRLQELMKRNEEQFEKVIDREFSFINGKTYALSTYAWKVSKSAKKVFYTAHGRDVSELKNLLLEKNYLMREVQGAEQIQKLMLPKQEAQIGDSEISCFYRPAAECSGDFLHYNIHENGLILWAGDVTGHGVGAAMISGCVRSAIALMEEDPAKLNASKAMEKINRSLLKVANNEYWMSFQIVVFDFKNKKFRSCQAGHTEIYCLDLDQVSSAKWRDFKILNTEQSHVLGMTEDPKFIESEHSLDANRVYLSFSDGLYETTNKKEAMYGKRRLLKSFLEEFGKNQNLMDSKEKVLNNILEFSDHAPLADDLSFWAFSFKA
jgi:sigma-B regulation protein RsbU (phosphoserine phosphatase)